MCFSTEASFTAAVSLGAIGILTFKKTSSPNQYFLASIPLLFALQQLSEGLIWLHLREGVGPEGLLTFSKYYFLTFAFLVWPIWLPLAFASLEPIKWRRSLLFVNLLFGFILSLLNFTYALQEGVTVKIVNHSIQYIGNIPSQEILYPLIVILPMFLSSVKDVWIYGVFVFAGLLVANYYYIETSTSVWCFFAAVVSLFIYKIVSNNKLSTS